MRFTSAFLIVVIAVRAQIQLGPGFGMITSYGTVVDDFVSPANVTGYEYQTYGNILAPTSIIGLYGPNVLTVLSIGIAPPGISTIGIDRVDWFVAGPTESYTYSSTVGAPFPLFGTHQPYGNSTKAIRDWVAAGFATDAGEYYIRATPWLGGVEGDTLTVNWTLVYLSSDSPTTFPTASPTSAPTRAPTTTTTTGGTTTTTATTTRRRFDNTQTPEESSLLVPLLIGALILVLLIVGAICGALAMRVGGGKRRAGGGGAKKRQSRRPSSANSRIGSRRQSAVHTDGGGGGDSFGGGSTVVFHAQPPPPTRTNYLAAPPQPSFTSEYINTGAARNESFYVAPSEASSAEYQVLPTNSDGSSGWPVQQPHVEYEVGDWNGRARNEPQYQELSQFYGY